MAERNKWIVLVSKLLEATQKNEIKWRIAPAPNVILDLGEKVSHVYETEFMGKKFRVYSFLHKTWIDELDRFEWVESIKLEFVDALDRSLFQVPRVAGIYDLLEAVKYQTADIDQFLDQLAN